MKGSEYIEVKIGSAMPGPVPCRFIVPQHEIVQYFSGVQSKLDAIEGFLDHGSRCFSNLAVFSVFSRSIQFLKGRGDNIKDCSQLGTFDVDKNTIVRRAIVSKFPYRGTIPVGEDEKSLIGRFFNSYPEEVFIYPGSIRGEETDILFYANGFEGDRESSLSTFEYIVEKAILSLKLLWVQKQLTTI